MSFHGNFARILACAGMIFILAACTTPTPAAPATAAAATAAPATASPATAAPAATVPATETTAPLPSETPVSPTASAVPATPVSATATTAATAISATGTPAAAGSLITPQNAASLTASALTLPGYPSQLFWPSANASLPAGLAGAPLVVRSENTLYPLKLNPPALGNAVPLPSVGDSSQLFLAPDLSSAVALGQNAPTNLIDLSGKVLKTLGGPGGYGASYSPDGKRLAVTSSNQLAATLYDLPGGTQAAQLTGFQTAAPVYSVGVVPGNQMIYWISRATLQLQDVASGQMGAKLNYQDFIGSFAFTPDGQRLVVYVASNLYVYQLPDLKELNHLALSQPASSLSISPDGSLLAAAYGPDISLFELGQKGAGLLPVGILKGPNDSTSLVAFSPDGRTLVSAHDNNIVEIWKAP